MANKEGFRVAIGIAKPNKAMAKSPVAKVPKSAKKMAHMPKLGGHR